MRRTDRIDRISLTLIGLILLAAGALGLARSYGAFGRAEASDPFLLDDLRSFVGRNGDWIWPCAFVGALVVAYLGYRLLRLQIVAGPKPRAIEHIESDDSISFASSALTDAIAEDLDRYPTIASARARVVHTADAGAAEIDLALTVADDVALGELRRQIEAEAMVRARTAIESSSVCPHVVLTLTETSRRRLD
jgi:hypothetical protein